MPHVDREQETKTVVGSNSRVTVTEIGPVALESIQVHQTKEFSIGILGVLVSIPMTDGTWLPEKTTMAISARMFLSRLRFQMEQTSSNYTLEPATESARP